MPLTPVEILHKEFSRGFRGYHDTEVQEFLREVARDWERVLAEFARTKEEKHSLQQRLQQFERMQDTLQKTLVMAQTAAEDTRINAQRRADVIVADAERQRDDLVNAARARAAELDLEAARVQHQSDQFTAQFRGLLRAHEEVLDRNALGVPAPQPPPPVEPLIEPAPLTTHHSPLTKTNSHHDEPELVEAAPGERLINWRGIPHE